MEDKKTTRIPTNTDLSSKTEAKASAKPARVRLKNTRPGNGAVGAIATPLKKDAAAWRAIGWIDAD